MKIFVTLPLCFVSIADTAYPSQSSTAAHLISEWSERIRAPVEVAKRMLHHTLFNNLAYFITLLFPSLKEVFQNLNEPLSTFLCRLCTQSTHKPFATQSGIHIYESACIPIIGTGFIRIGKRPFGNLLILYEFHRLAIAFDFVCMYTCRKKRLLGQRR